MVRIKSITSSPPSPRPPRRALPRRSRGTQYLGLRLFAHPWDRGTADFRKGPGDGLADALSGDPCLSGLFRADGASRESGGGGGRSGSGSGRGAGRGENGSGGAGKVADTLRKVGALSEWMRLRAAALLKEEREEKTGASPGGGGEEGGGGSGSGGGSCAFNLTLINRMECSGAKRDLKPDPLFAMGKCSVSWHADSCLQDFSTIGKMLAAGSLGRCSLQWRGVAPASSSRAWFAVRSVTGVQRETRCGTTNI